MKIIFFGTPIFAADILKGLIQEKFDVTAVVTAPDSQKGRGKKIKECAVKILGQENNLPILQPKNLNNKEFIKELESFKADLFVVVAFRMLPKTVWKIPPKGSINLHTSLLPLYRGAAPINWAIINGEEKTGASIFFINDKIDEGDIILQKATPLSKEITAAQLHNNLIKIGFELLIESLQSIQKNCIKITSQKDNKPIKKAPKITKELCKINWGHEAVKIHNLVRGLSPFLNNEFILKDVSIFPSAWFILQDTSGREKRIKVLLTEIIKSKHNTPLKIHTDEKTYLHITTVKDTIAILHLQAEGKRAMTIEQFLQGNKINKQYTIK